MLKDEIKELSDITLRRMLQRNREVIRSMDASLPRQPELIDAVCHLINDSRDGNMLENFNAMAAKDPEMMQRVLILSLTGYMIHHCITAIDGELKRRAARHN